MEKNKKCESKFAFIGVFFVGVFLLGVTANYYIQKEPGEEREARSRRVAQEVERFKKSGALISQSDAHQ